jgi:hypothetical protein
MYSNARFLPHFILLLGFIFFTFNGVFVIRTRSFTMPLTRRRQVEGRKAIVPGIVSVVFGVWCFAGLIGALHYNFDGLFAGILRLF